MSRGTTVRRRVGCAVLLALLPAVPVGAQGQVSDPEQRPTLLIGPVEVRPRLVLSNVGIDSNVFHESDNPRSDFTATFSPDVAGVRSDRQAHAGCGGAHSAHVRGLAWGQGRPPGAA